MQELPLGSFSFSFYLIIWTGWKCSRKSIYFSVDRLDDGRLFNFSRKYYG